MNATTSRAFEADVAFDFLNNLTNEAITEFFSNTGISKNRETRKKGMVE